MIPFATELGRGFAVNVIFVSLAGFGLSTSVIFYRCISARGRLRGQRVLLGKIAAASWVGCWVLIATIVVLVCRR